MVLMFTSYSKQLPESEYLRYNLTFGCLFINPDLVLCSYTVVNKT